MYRFIIPLVFTLSINVCVIAQLNPSQSGSNPNKSESKIVVTNWSKRIFALSQNFWGEKADTVIKQVGNEEFQYMKEHGPGTYPEQMVLFAEGNLKNPDSLYKKLSKLNYELAARFRHFNDQGTYIGIYALLRVPYSLNKDWDPLAKWDTVYFVFPMHALKVVN